jgi:ribose transport system substrate-binding protein
MKRVREVMVTGGCLLVALGSVAGCGSSDDDAGGGAQAASQTTKGDAIDNELKPFLAPPKLPEWPALATAPEKALKLAYVGGGSGTAAVTSDALKDAAGALSWKYQRLTVDTSDPGAVDSAMLSAVNAGADVIVNSAGAESVKNALNVATKAKVPVVQLYAPDAGLPGFTASIAATKVSAEAWGKVMGLAVLSDAKRAGKTAHVGLITSSALPNFEPIADAAIATIKRNCAKCTADKIDTPAADLTTGQVGRGVVSFIQRKPQTNYVQFSVGFLSGGVRTALDGAGLKQVKFIGMVPTTAQLKELRDGKDVGWVAYPNQLDAYLAVDAAARALTGGDPKIHNQEVEPVWLLTDKSEYDEKVTPELPVDYRAHFSKLWKVG